MFAAVLKKGDVPRNRFGVGTFISIVVHVALVAVVIWYGSRPAPEETTEVPDLTFFAASRPPPPPPPPAGSSVRPKSEKREKPHKKEALVQPKELPQQKPAEAEPQPEEEDSAADDAVMGEPGGEPGGEVGGQMGGEPGGKPDGVVGGTGIDVVPFGEGMTRPSVDQQELVRNLYTREALEAHIEGLMIVKCNVLAEGELRHCRVIKPLPHLGDAVVERLESMKAKPGTFQGRPIAIDYVFNFRFQLPR